MLLDVSGWDAGSGSVKCDTIYGAIAYDHPISGKLYMLVYHQAIHCPIFTRHLMCPIQSQMTRIRINELPKFLDEDADESLH